jgi:hypothetical protein
VFRLIAAAPNSRCVLVCLSTRLKDAMKGVPIDRRCDNPVCETPHDRDIKHLATVKSGVFSLCGPCRTIYRDPKCYKCMNCGMWVGISGMAPLASVKIPDRFSRCTVDGPKWLPKLYIMYPALFSVILRPTCSQVCYNAIRKRLCCTCGKTRPPHWILCGDPDLICVECYSVKCNCCNYVWYPRRILTDNEKVCKKCVDMVRAFDLNTFNLLVTLLGLRDTVYKITKKGILYRNDRDAPVTAALCDICDRQLITDGVFDGGICRCKMLCRDCWNHADYANKLASDDLVSKICHKTYGRHNADALRRHIMSRG